MMVVMVVMARLLGTLEIGLQGLESLLRGGQVSRGKGLAQGVHVRGYRALPGGRRRRKGILCLRLTGQELLQQGREGIIRRGRSLGAPRPEEGRKLICGRQWIQG